MKLSRREVIIISTALGTFAALCEENGPAYAKTVKLMNKWDEGLRNLKRVQVTGTQKKRKR